MAHFPEQSDSLSTLYEAAKQILAVSRNHLSFLEQTKDHPEIFDEEVFLFALRSYKEVEGLLPVLKESCQEGRRKTLSQSQANQLKEIEGMVQELEKIHPQILFLMDGMKDYVTSDLFNLKGIEGILEQESLFKNTEKSLMQKLIEETRELKQSIGKTKKAPETEEEKQVHHIIGRFEEILQKLVLEPIHPQILISSLFCQWLHMATLLQDEKEEFFEHQVQNAPFLMERIIEKLNEIERKIEDEKPTPFLKKLGEKINLLKKLSKRQEKRLLSEQDKEEQLARVNNVFRAFFEDCKGIRLNLLASLFLYYWLRILTFESGVEEGYFQKLERHWPEVFEEVSAYGFSLMDPKISFFSTRKA